MATPGPLTRSRRNRPIDETSNHKRVSMVYQMAEKRRPPLQVRISPDLEARITQQASTAGEPVPDFLRRVLYEVTAERREVAAEGTAAR